MAKIIAVVSLDPDKIGGGAPIFIAPDEAGMQRDGFSA